jgi:hypothetical protein
MATAPEAITPCPACHSANVADLAMLSKRDPDFDFFMCHICDHAWKIPKQLAVAGAHPHPDDGHEEPCTYPGCTNIARFSRETVDDRPRRRTSDSPAPIGGLIAAWRCPLGHVVSVEE